MKKTNFHIDEQNYNFNALRGIQAGREFYVIMCPFKVIPKMFLFNEEEVSPDLRSQRTINKARIPEIANYLLNNPTEYCFSAITASIDGNIEFTPFNNNLSNVGTLKIPIDSQFIVNDGQHRRAAIEESLKKNANLGIEAITVVLFVDKGLKRSQQMFADLNKHAVRPSRSLGVLYDHRDPLSDLCMQIINRVEVFQGMIDLEKTSISNRARKLFTLSSLYQATKSLLNKDGRKTKINEKEFEVVVEYWKEVASKFKEWQDMKNSKIDPASFRKCYVHGHGVILHALGIVGHSLLSNYPKEWNKKLKGLSSIDWSRDNVSLWENRAMVGGRMSASQMNLILTSAIIKRKLNIELTPEEVNYEKKIGDNR